MGKQKKDTKYNVVSIRVSDREKAFLDALTRRDRTTVTALIRKALRTYIHYQMPLQGIAESTAEGQAG